MRWNRVWVLVAALLVSALFGGLVTQEAQAQTYKFEVVNVLQRNFLIGQDIIVVWQLTVLESRRLTDDTVNVTIFSPDPSIPASSSNLLIPVTQPTGELPRFYTRQVTGVDGEFTLIVDSALEGSLRPPQNYPVLNYDVSVEATMTTGEIETQLLVTTTIDRGNMSEVQTRFDIEYVLDGVALRENDLVILFGEVLGTIAFDGSLFLFDQQNLEYHSWQVTKEFTLAPGNHTLTVNVIDQAFAKRVFSKTFVLGVTGEIQTIEARLNELNDRAASAEVASVTATSLAFLAVAAIVLSVLTLLIQLGIVKIGRFGRFGREGEE